MKPRRGLAIHLDESDLLTLPEAAPRLFLGRFDSAGLAREMEEAGVMEALARRGYPDVELRTAYEAGEHRLSIDSPSDGVSLVELRFLEAASAVQDPLLRDLGLEVLSFLAITWLALQHPRGEFTPDRPRLPGQRHPGLGIGKLLFARVTAWSQAWGKDAVLNFPGYFHNARFYAPPFGFLSPREHGRFEALCRDLASLHVAEASAAIEEGRVIEEPGERVFAWEPGEMVAPLTERVRGVLEAPAYREAVTQAREAVRFRVRGPGRRRRKAAEPD